MINLQTSPHYFVASLPWFQNRIESANKNSHQAGNNQQSAQYLVLPVIKSKIKGKTYYSGRFRTGTTTPKRKSNASISKVGKFACFSTDLLIFPLFYYLWCGDKFIVWHFLIISMMRDSKGVKNKDFLLILGLHIVYWENR